MRSQTAVSVAAARPEVEPRTAMPVMAGSAGETEAMPVVAGSVEETEARSEATVGRNHDSSLRRSRQPPQDCTRHSRSS